VTGYRRLTILAVAVLLAAGCGATSPSLTARPSSGRPSQPVPSIGPSPTDQVVETLPPTDAPPTTPEPSEGTCPTDPPTTQPAVWLSSPLAQGQPVVDITRMARVTDPATALPVPDLEHPPSLVNFVGGRRAFLDLYYVDFQWPWGWNVTTLSAKLTIEGRAPVKLDVELATDSLGNVSGASVRIPDREGRGVLDVNVAWGDACFVYEGVVSSRVHVYAESSVAECPTGRTAAFDELGIAFQPPIVAGGVAADLVPWQFAGKVRDMAVVDPLPPYVGFDAQTATLHVAAGASVTVASSNPAIELRPMEPPRVIFFERAPLIRWLDDGWIHGNEPEAPVVFGSKLVAREDGTFTFKAPPDPGRYAAEVTFYYDAACTVGTAGFVIGVDVQ
jgi:hypothetical protein